MARRAEEIARIHLQARLVRPEFEPAPRGRILDPRHQMRVCGHLAAEHPIMVVAAAEDDLQIGRAMCRERVGQYVAISVVAVSIKKKLTQNTTIEETV